MPLTRKLTNGLPIILAPMHDTQAITVFILVKVGSRYESAKVSGISHFIEHLLFKGGKKRRTSLAITKALDSVGAEYNAFTGKDLTGYYIKVAKKHLPLALDVLSDMVLSPLFDAKELEKERGVIIEEINMYEDNPLMGIDSYFEEQLFLGHPLSRKISGEKEDILRISRKDIIDYYKKNYLQGKIIVGLGGNLPTDVLELTEKFFGKQKLKNQAIPFQKFVSQQQKPRFKIIAKDNQQIQVMMGFPAYNQNHPLHYATALLSIMLGGNMSSRLFTEIREKRGLCYFVRASYDAYEDTGAFYISAGLDQSRLVLALTTIKAELNKIKKIPPQKTEITKAKEFLKGKMILNLEDSDDIIAWLVKQQLFTGKMETLEQKLAKIDAVTEAQIALAAKNIIDWKKFSLAMIGSDKQQKDILEIFK